MTVDELITKEIQMYVSHCRKAALHDDEEPVYRDTAHKVFLHIQELRNLRILVSEDLMSR